MKKRILSLILTATMAVTLFSGCGKKAEDSKKTEEKITITYANWNLGAEGSDTLERRMVKAWNDSHPNIQVVIDESIDYSKYADSLSAAAAAGKFPDVIMIDNIPGALGNEWLADISQFTSKDEEWAKLPKPLEVATHYGKGVYAIPTGMYFMGYFVNDDLFQNENVNNLNFAPTFDEFMNAVKLLNKPSKGLVGLAEEVQIPEWYPAMVNKNLGHFTFDGTKYNLDDPAFIEGVNKAKDIFNNKYVYDSLSDEQKKQYNAGWYGDVWNQGKIAIRWDGTWALKDYNNLSFKSRFIGVPGGRTVLVGDFLGISKSSKHAEAAYEFAKFMSFSKEGILKRMELASVDKSMTTLPVTTDKEVLDKYFSQNSYEGLKEAYDVIDNAIVEGVKVVPGYINSRWTAPTGIKVGDKENANIGDVIWDCMRGKTKIQDYAAQLNKLANEQYNKAMETISKVTNK